MFIEKSTISCRTCGASHDVPVDGDEDGRYASLDTVQCGECGRRLCSCCEQFDCDGCGHTFCLDHKIAVYELDCCRQCAIEALMANEPEGAYCEVPQEVA